jgi:flagellar biogenesis protein FliO
MIPFLLLLFAPLFALADGPPGTQTFQPEVPPQAITYEQTFGKMLLILFLLVAFVVIVVWLLRRITQGKFRFGGSSTIQIIERRNLSPKTMLYLIEVRGKPILISESQLEVRPLTTDLPQE